MVLKLISEVEPSAKGHTSAVVTIVKLMDARSFLCSATCALLCHVILFLPILAPLKIFARVKIFYTEFALFLQHLLLFLCSFNISTFEKSLHKDFASSK
jgi:hypothetical protein